MTEQEFAQQIGEAGGTLYIVGGWVRDRLMGKEPNDKDYVVVGLSKESFEVCFPSAKLIGNAFPVFLVKINDVSCEVAFARKEKKVGAGYTGFDIVADEDITIEEDLYRRDTTVNSIAMEVLTGNIVDLYGGRQDIADRVLRPVSEHFSEDPVRALRAARQATQLGFSVSDELIEAMKGCREELKGEPPERILGELKRALETKQPSVFFQVLKRAELLETLFPEIYALIGKTQPVDFHPEGDAYNHTMLVTDKVAAATDNVVAVFAGLVHDIGKGVTPEDMLPHHYDHEKKGLDVLKRWNERAKFSNLWMRAGALVIEEHMRAPLMQKPGKITDFILLLHKMASYLPPEDFCHIIRADHGQLPAYLERYTELRDVLLSIDGNMAPEGVQGKALGEWLRHQRVMACTRWLKG
ncbi:tRNA nucleotidyltransferase [Anaerovibrio sp. JC8]|uniref:HD domain-containing protein n=1 Tax=Anaerovibrio sp. JC8 TaxID=1240085 RepID=UPI000A09C3D7|nr:HD domain-containing protein [Anaerovibrio sp. JC8]ORU00280.1 tRNA nucleotidyltransferase [Anaerovibrio sp. JC8]